MESFNSPVDWQALVFDGWISRLERIALKRFGQQVIADQAVNHVLDRLSENQWSALNGYKYKAQPINYLNVVAANLLEEFSRSKFGRPRPPVWLKKNGSLWVSIWRQVCLERQLTGQVIANWTTENRNQDYLEKIVRLIKARIPWCGVKHEEIPSSCFEQDSEQNNFEFEAQPTHNEQNNTENFEEILLLIRLFIAPDSPTANISTPLLNRVKKNLQRLKDELTFSEQELLILKMVYIEQIKQTVVAETFNLKPYQLSKQLSALMLRLRSALTTTGFNKEQFFE